MSRLLRNFPASICDQETLNGHLTLQNTHLVNVMSPHLFRDCNKLVNHIFFSHGYISLLSVLTKLYYIFIFSQHVLSSVVFIYHLGTKKYRQIPLKKL